MGLMQREQGLVGVLLGEAPTRAEAVSISNRYRSCPYCASLASAGHTVIGVFSVPVDQQWWLEWVTDHPKATLGLERAEVFFAQQVTASSSWSRGEVSPALAQAPCGADCRECPAYYSQCKGCPATQHYAGAKA
jgi:hypothetical protein